MSAKLTTNVDQRLLRTTKFPPEFNKKVDMSKVNINVIKKWISDEITRLVGFEDDVVVEMVCNIIEGSQAPDIKVLQIQLNGFLDKNAPVFCRKLWSLCLSAQENAQGVPKELLDAKKSEIEQERLEMEKARDDAVRRKEAEMERDRQVDRVRQRERTERDRDRWGGRGGGRDRDHDRPPPRDSRSPPRRRWRDDDDFHRTRRDTDSYIPSRSRRDDRRPRRRRSPSYGRSASRSRSPEPKRSRRRSSSPSPRPSPSPPRRQRPQPSRTPRQPTQKRRENSSSDDRVATEEVSARARKQTNGHESQRSMRETTRGQRSPSSNDSSSRSTSPPAKRRRRQPSRSQSPARTGSSEVASAVPASPHQARRARDAPLPPGDLMANANRRKESYRDDPHRLTRERTDHSGSESP